MAIKTKECPACAMEIDASSKICPICNYQFPRQSRGLAGAAIALAILFLLYLIIF